MRLPRMRLRLWHLMAVVAIVGIVASAYVWFFPPAPAPNHAVWRSNFSVTVEVGGYVFPTPHLCSGSS
jgi:hypothetical protein